MSAIARVTTLPGQGTSPASIPTYEQVCSFFRASPYPHLVRLVASVHDAEVVLEGTSHSFHTKQLAQNVAARCPGVVRVTNLIRVNY